MDTTKRTRKRLRNAKQAKKLYLRGYSTEEISTIMGIEKLSVNRYYILLGGLSDIDKATHYKNKFILKLPEKDKLKSLKVSPL